MLFWGFLLPIFVEVVHPFFWRQIVDVTFFNFPATLAATLCRQVVWTAISVEPVIDALHTCYHSSAPASFMLARELSTAGYTNATAAKSSNTSLSCLQEVSFLGVGARHWRGGGVLGLQEWTVRERVFERVFVNSLIVIRIWVGIQGPIDVQVCISSCMYADICLYI